MKHEIFIFLIIIYCVYNILTFATYGYDKYCAGKGKWRVSEGRLMGMAFFFGGAGAFLGMQVFRHKTKHLQFQILVPIFMVVQAIMWVVIARCVLY